MQSIPNKTSFNAFNPLPQSHDDDSWRLAQVGPRDDIDDSAEITEARIKEHVDGLEPECSSSEDDQAFFQEESDVSIEDDVWKKHIAKIFPTLCMEPTNTKYQNNCYYELCRLVNQNRSFQSLLKEVQATLVYQAPVDVTDLLALIGTFRPSCSGNIYCLIVGFDIHSETMAAPAPNACLLKVGEEGVLETAVILVPKWMNELSTEKSLILNAILDFQLVEVFGSENVFDSQPVKGDNLYPINDNPSGQNINLLSQTATLTDRSPRANVRQSNPASQAHVNTPNITTTTTNNLANEHAALFDKKLSSALKVTDVETAKSILRPQIRKGWRWVSPIADDDNGATLVTNARKIPELSQRDWVVMEGKTMRIIKAGSPDAIRLERELAKNRRNASLNNRDNTQAKDDIASLSNALSEININKIENALYPRQLSKDFFPNSYARLGGTRVRQIERLLYLSKLCRKVFEFEAISQPICTKLLSDTSFTLYNTYFSVKLKNDLLTPADVVLLHKALGIKIKKHTLTPDSTIENTLPLQKVLKILTCYGTLTDVEGPWLVSLRLFNGTRQFLLTPVDPNTNPNQLMVSMSDKTIGGVAHFVGHPYTYWLSDHRIKPENFDELLNHPISHITTYNDNWKKIVEFMVCTQVAEAHCMPGHLDKSRVPGADKHARAIIRHHIKEKNPKLYSSFIDKPEHQRVFPMAGDGGTGNTRKAVNRLTKPDKKAPCSDMSSDSDVPSYESDAPDNPSSV